MPRTADAVVIGAGIVGCSVAAAFARAGLKVVVVDRHRGTAQGSTSASSAIIRLHYSTRPGVAVAWESKHQWERWRDFIGVDDPAGNARYIETGALVLDTPTFDSQGVLEHYDALGIPYQRLDAAAIAERFPWLSPDRFFPPRLPDDPGFWDEANGVLGGFFTQHAGFVDDPALAAHNLLCAAQNADATAVFGRTVASIERDGSAVTGVRLDDGETITAGIVVNAAGPASTHVNDLAGVTEEFRIRTRPMRQEVHAVTAPLAVDSAFGPTVNDGDLGTYFRFAPGGQILVGSQEPKCDPLDWLDDPDAYDNQPTAAAFERQTLRLARRIPDLTVPNRPTGIGAVYDVADDWIPVYDRTSLDGYFVAIGTSGNQFKNAPVIGELILALVRARAAGIDHDADPVQWTAPITGHVVPLDHYSRQRSPNPKSSGTVLG